MIEPGNSRLVGLICVVLIVGAFVLSITTGLAFVAGFLVGGVGTAINAGRALRARGRR